MYADALVRLCPKGLVKDPRDERPNIKETKNVSSFDDVVTNRMGVLAGIVKTI